MYMSSNEILLFDQTPSSSYLEKTAHVAFRQGRMSTFPFSLALRSILLRYSECDTNFDSTRKGIGETRERGREAECIQTSFVSMGTL
jgi:hypothetical protein